MLSIPHTPFNPLAPDVIANPYPYYAWLRENDPIHWGAPGDPDAEGCWYITRYDDVLAILKDHRFGREIWRVLPPPESPQNSEDAAIVEMSRQWMVLRDPPAHTRLRHFVLRAFTPRRIANLTPHIRAITNTLIDQVEEQGQMDVIADFAFPLAVIVIAELLGIPPEDRTRFVPWTKALAAVIEFKQSDDVQSEGSQAITELNDYLRAIIADRRRDPQDDLLSALIAADETPPISETELLGTCTQLLFGGNDPVAHLIGNGLLALFRHSDQMDRWRTKPALAETAIDELLRYDSSVQMTFRYALEDVPFGGKTMRQGDTIALVFGAANRDPAQFPNPECLDLARSPNRHLSLGQGVHYCLGAALSRVEGQVAFNTLLTRLPDLTLATDTLEWADTVAVRGLKRLPISFGGKSL